MEELDALGWHQQVVIHKVGLCIEVGRQFKRCCPKSIRALVAHEDGLISFPDDHVVSSEQGFTAMVTQLADRD